MTTPRPNFTVEEVEQKIIAEFSPAIGSFTIGESAIGITTDAVIAIIPVNRAFLYGPLCAGIDALTGL